MSAKAVNVNDIIDRAKFSGFHFQVVAWCLLIILFDGYDLAINGVVLPLLMQDWGLSAVQAGMLASTALAGMMFGAMIFGSLADKIGRKKVIIICVTLFSGSLLRVALHQTRLNLVFYALSRVLGLVVYYQTWLL